MKLATVGERVVRIGHEAESGFKIKATAKAFKILSSSLYKDKIAAILRELSANAYDAHIAAGCPERPFEVHLPHQLEPYLSIRDYGPGLSHDDVLELYSTYFESTKTDSNDYIGALGLGSKSPFSYVKSFTVVSRFQGVQCTYDAFMNEKGMPAVALRHQMPHDTSLESGLEVIVPVTNRNDFYEFAHKAQQTYLHYPVRPKVIGHNFSFLTRKTVMSGDGWRIVENGHRDRAIAIMGIVGYPIDYDALASANIPGDRGKFDRDAVRQLVFSSVEIEFPVGALDVTAGREELSYDNDTVVALRARLQEVVVGIRKKVSEEFKACKSFREAKQKYKNLFEYGSLLQRLLGHNYEITFRGRKITDGDFVLDLAKFPNTVLRYYRDYSERGSLKNYSTLRFDKETPWDNSFKFAPGEALEWLWQDLPLAQASGRVFGYRAENRKRRVIVIETADAAERTALKWFLNGYEIGNVSDLPKPPPTPRARAKVRKLSPTKAALADAIRTPHSTDWWPSTTVTIEDGGVYVPTKHNKFVREIDDKFVESVEAFSEAYVAARQLGFIMSKDALYAIPSTELKPFETSAVWFDFWSWLRERTEDRIAADPSIPEKIVTARSCKDFNDLPQAWAIKERIERIARHLPESHALAIFHRELKESEKTPSTIVNMMLVAKHTGVDINLTGENDPRFVSRWNDIQRRYPLLSFLVANRYEQPSPELTAEYITQVDASRSNGVTK